MGGDGGGDDGGEDGDESVECVGPPEGGQHGL